MAGGGRQKMGVVLGPCLALLVQISSAATSHTVGDSTGWTIPSSSSFYPSWASKQTFKVGDFLVFNFQSGIHTVAEVSKSAYASCATANPITQVNNGPANLTISSAGTHYYICTIAGHCAAGQKLSVTAAAAAPSPPSPAAPAPKSGTPPAAAPTPKSGTPPTAAPTPKTTPTSAPTPATTPATAPPPKTATTPTPAPSASTPSATTPTVSPAAVPSGSRPAASSPGGSAPTSPSSASPAGGPSGGAPTTPSTSPPGEAPTASTPPPSSASVATAGLVLPLLVIAGANFLY